MGQKNTNKLIQAYHDLIHRIKHTFSKDLDNAHHYIDIAVDKAVELNELSREEAERIGNYLRRDINDAAKYLVENENELSDWLRFDLELVEDRLLDTFSTMVNKFKTEQPDSNINHSEISEHVYYSGEIAGPGSLKCNICNEIFNFHEPVSIPACHKCANISFKRITN
jgi:formylmethanofuran dehydrogenase subunit E